MVTSGTSRTSLGSGEGKRLGAQGCVLVEDLTTGPTPDTEKSSDRKVFKPWGKKEKGGGRLTQDGQLGPAAENTTQ